MGKMCLRSAFVNIHVRYAVTQPARIGLTAIDCRNHLLEERGIANVIRITV